MMMEYNNTEEYNGIQTGNTVYISGLYGKNHSFVNNKYGYVKDILIMAKNNRISYVAQVVLIPTNEECFVNFEYIFKVGIRFNDIDIKAMIWEKDPMNHYIFKKNLIKVEAFHDDNDQLLAVCTDINRRNHVLLCSGIN